MSKPTLKDKRMASFEEMKSYVFFICIMAFVNTFFIQLNSPSKFMDVLVSVTITFTAIKFLFLKIQNESWEVIYDILLFLFIIIFTEAEGMLVYVINNLSIVIAFLMYLYLKYELKRTQL